MKRIHMKHSYHLFTELLFIIHCVHVTQTLTLSAAVVIMIMPSNKDRLIDLPEDAQLLWVGHLSRRMDPHATQLLMLAQMITLL